MKTGPKARTLGQVIDKAKNIWNNKYDYSETIINGKYLENIYCSEHNVYFRQIKGNHLFGKIGCKQCASENRTKLQTLDKAEFLKRLKQRREDFDNFNFQEFKYVDSMTKTTVICNVCGYKYLSTPHNLMIGACCDNCNSLKNSKNYIRPLSDCIEEIKTHSNAETLDFSECFKVEYRGQEQKLPIVCTKHGMFYKTISSMLLGGGCPKCASNHKMTTEEFIDKCKSKREDFEDYNFDKVSYVGKQTNIIVTCLKHGDFQVKPGNFLNGKTRCPKCALEQKRKTTEEFIRHAKAIHGDKFNYEDTVYRGTQEYVEIFCNEEFPDGTKHGKFIQLAQNHLLGHNGCKYCNNVWVSNTEIDMKNFISTLGNFQVINNYRITIDNERYELDVYIESLKLGIEYNGIYWHSDFHKLKEYHYNKKRKFEALGIRVLMIWESQSESEWKKEIEDYIQEVSSKKLITEPGVYDYDKYSVLDFDTSLVEVVHKLPEPKYFHGSKPITSDEFDESKTTHNRVYGCGTLEVFTKK